LQKRQAYSEGAYDIIVYPSEEKSIFRGKAEGGLGVQ